MWWGTKPFQRRAVGPRPAFLTHLFLGGSHPSPAGSAQQVSLEVLNPPSAGLIFGTQAIVQRLGSSNS